MENQQTTTEVNAQIEPLNDAENGTPRAGGENWRMTRVKKIKDKVLPGVKITLLISLIINIAMLIIGILAVNKCPVQDNIPLYLIATGAIGLVSKIITVARERITRHIKTSFMESSLYTVEIVFLIMGSYWVYKVYPPSYNPADGKLYCQKTAYMMAFVYLTFFYAVILCILAGFVCFLCCICLLATAPDPDVEANIEETVGEKREEKKEEKREEKKEEKNEPKSETA